MPDQTDMRTRIHLWVTLLVALAVVAGVGSTLIAARLAPGSSGSSVESLVDGVLHLSTLSDAHLLCPRDIAFSPDGSRIVVLGLLAPASSASSSPIPSACPSAANGTAAIDASGYAATIFESATGQIARTFPLDPLVLTATGDGTAAAPHLAHVTYSGLGWSPDGTLIAFVFTEFGGSGQRTPENVVDSGLLLVDVASAAPTVLRGDSGFFAMANGVSSGFPVWHLKDSSELPSFIPDPGLGYAWNADGTPYPNLPLHDSLSQLPIAASARYPVGIPDGGPRFTIWQPGLVVGSIGDEMDSPTITFVSAFPAWSPDGAHVALMVTGVTLSNDGGAPMMGRTAAMRHAREPTIPPPMPIPSSLPLVPSRDAALAAVQEAVSDQGWALVGWNPSGSLLGSINCFAARDQALEVRDTATGGLLATEPLDQVPGDLGCRDTPDPSVVGAYPSLGLSLAWSPQGDRLLTADRATGVLTLYHIRHRPAS